MQEIEKKVLRFCVVFIAAVTTGCLTGCGSGGSGASPKSLAVTDPGNNRVLIYNLPNSTNQAATMVVGQPDAVSNTANNGGRSASTMSFPTGVVEGTQHELVVADEGNCRVLIFQAPLTSGMAATTILGQPDEVTANCLGGSAATAAGLYFPTGAAFDKHGNLWVADQNNSRVLEYQPPFTSGMAASVALGQTATDGASGTYGCNQVGHGAPHPPGGPPPAATSGTLCYPPHLAFDSTGDLWVVDAYNNRVLMYPPAEQKQGGVATVVLGQQNFLSSKNGTTNATLYYPWDLAFDSAGNMWVADYLNERVLKYQPPFTTGMAASAVLGQTDFVTSTGGTSATKFDGPSGLAFDFSGNLAVADANNNRSLIFPTSEQVTGGSGTIALGQPNLTSGNQNQGGSTSDVTEWLPQGLVAYR
jgi:NHL repeat-containing protein